MRRAAVLAAVLLVFATWQASLFNQYLDSLAQEPGDSLPKVDAIVSLAGAAGRLDRGLDLLLEGKADVLLLSGTGKGATLQDIFPGRDVTNLESGQVILLESRSTSTYENAIEAWAVLNARGGGNAPREIVLLTSNYHMLRSQYVFHRVFPDDVGIHPYPVAKEHFARGKWWKDGRARKTVFVEYMKYLWYRTRY